MHLRNTLILVTIALCLGLFIFVFEKNTPSTRDIQEMQRMAFPDFKGKLVEADAIEIIRASGKVVLVKRDVGTAAEHWQLTQPIDYPADMSRVIALLSGFETAERVLLAEGQRAKPLSVTGDLGEYGLSQESAIHVRAMRGDKTLLDALIGGETAAEGKIYAAPADRSEVFVIDAKVRENTAVRVDELRDKRMLNLARGRVSQVTVLKDEQPVFQITRQGKSHWQLTLPFADRANKLKADKLAERVGSLWADAFREDFAQDDLKMLRKLTDYGLKPAMRSVKVTRIVGGKPQQHEVLFGKRVKKTEGDETSWDVYAMVAGSRSVVFLPEAAIDVFLAVPDDIRSRNPLRFEPAEVSRIMIDRPRDRFELLKQNGTWSITSPVESRADDERVRGLLKSLAGLRATGFKPFGTELTKPIAVRISVGTGDEQKHELAYVEPAQGDTVTARRGEEGAVMSLPSSVLDLVNRPALRFQSREVVKFNADNLARLSTRRDGRERAATRSDAGWKLVGEGTIDIGAADGMKWALSDLVADEFVAPAAETDLAALGLDSPGLRVEAEVSPAAGGTGSKIVLLVGGIKDEKADNKQHYAMLEGGELVFLLSNHIVTALGKDLGKPAE